MTTDNGQIPFVGKVLVAEDNAAMRQLLAGICREWAGEVIECSNGAQAVQAFAQHQPDLVLMDFAMPEMDGLAATRRIRAQSPQARILIVTQYDSEGLRQEARNAGVSGCLRKEDLDQLRPLVHALNALPDGA
jgi:two-component system NarL family response regulator